MSATVFGSRTAPRLGFIPAFAFVALFSLVPALATLALSFTDVSAAPGIPLNWVGLENYREIFAGGLATQASAALVRTLIFSIVVSIVQNALALLIALLLNRRSRLALFTRSIVFLPSVLGVTVVGLLWSLIFNPIAGPASSLLQIFGLSSSFFGDPALALGLCIFVQIWMTVGYAALIYTAGLQALPGDVLEASAIDGVSGWQRLRLVTIPMLAPSITANMLISIIGSLQAFQLIYVLTGVENRSTDVLSLMLFRIGFGLGGAPQDQGVASAVSIVQFVVVALVALATYAYLRRQENQL